MLPAPYIVAKLDSLGLSEVAKYFSIILLNHILHNIRCSAHYASTLANHNSIIQFYANQELYYTRVESEILQDLTRYEETQVRLRVISWLEVTRTYFPPESLSLEFSLTDNLVGVRYV